jgi:thiol-disulfide isomerase/thioredoxin
MKLPIITEINSLAQFKDILANGDKKITIIKMGAKWCQPCKRIEPLVYQWADHLPDNVQMCYIDIDICIQLYSFLKKKRIVNGVPALLCYFKRETQDFIPDDSVIGADTNQINLFFQRCIQKC